MTRREEAATSTPVGGVLDDALTQFLVDYLRDSVIDSLQEPNQEATLDDVLLTADRSRATVPQGEAGASDPYSQRRHLLEAAGVMLGGPDTLQKVGRRFFDSIRNPERIELLQALGSPTAVYEALPELIEVFGLAFEMRTEVLAGDECRIEIRMKGEYEPFPELCAFGLGLASTLPQLFGYSVAEIIRESCQADGAPWCSARLCWASAGEDVVLAERAQMRFRLIQAQLGKARRSAGVDDLEPVLTRVIASVMPSQRRHRA
jgi:hypothetical protein